MQKKEYKNISKANCHFSLYGYIVIYTQKMHKEREQKLPKDNNIEKEN